MSRSLLLGAARSVRLRSAVERVPVTRRLVNRYVAGTGEEDAIRVADELVTEGLAVTIDHLGEDTLDAAQARRVGDAYVSLLGALHQAGLAADTEVSVKLSAVGQALPNDGEKIALEQARRICHAARNAATTVTLDMEDHTTTDSTLGILRELRLDFPETGAVLQAYLRRTEGDCRDLATEGSRVRLCKGAYDEPPDVAFSSRAEVDRSYVRCAKILLAGPGYPMLATHDPRLVEITGSLAARYRREQGSYEYQMLYGVRPDEQLRLVRAGERVRVYVPYGEDWYGYLVRRLAERPANLSLFLRSVASKR
ncbi:proline dehydrogenase [Phytoactinopolyspora alkaliphila]|uniref:proline dehydrogenase n=1 Tax=Phytoactinopolyspora alkaliphila TaxID=1783498 RepID=A0A6N9YI23_9ACTN|nr:proline dehydrogenase [Phytoactinopolyspora alkaliphila]